MLTYDTSDRLGQTNTLLAYSIGHIFLNNISTIGTLRVDEAQELND